MPALAPWQWALGALCAALVGIAKTGMPGAGILAVPLMEIIVGSAGASPGWLLPILCAADAIAIAYYRRHAQARRLFELAPWVLLGVPLGAAALRLPGGIRSRLVGAIVLVMVAAQIARKRRVAAGETAAVPWHHGARYGVVAGVATTAANAAGPVMSLYLLSRRLPKDEFVATGAWFFFLINLVKVPLYGGLGLFSGRSLLFDACLLPAVIAGALLGRTVMRRLRQETFERAVLALTIAAALWPFFK